MAVSPSTRQRILEACLGRLKASTIVARSEGDVSAVVLLGEVVDLGPDDPSEVMAIVAGEDIVRRQGAKFLITLPIELQAVVRVDLDEPHATAERMLADMKRAFELADRTLGGLVTQDSVQRLSTRPLPREMGMSTVGFGVTYTVDYQETWGAP